MSKKRAPTFSMETVDGRVLRVAVWRASAPTHNLPILFFNGIGANIEAMAQQFALQNTGRTNKLILCATSAGMLMVPGNPAALVKMADPRRYIDPDFMAKHFKTLYGGMVGNKSEHISRITPPSKTGYFYQLMAMMGWTSAPFLPFLKTETLVMMGDDDQIVPLANGKFLNFLIPNSELFVVKNGGHLFLLSHVEESITAIRAFLDRDAGKARKAA